MEVTAKGMEDVADIDVLERWSVQSIVRPRVAVVIGIDELPSRSSLSTSLLPWYIADL